MKKAEGLSLTTIVIAALCLLVLVVLSVIFVGKMSDTTGKQKDCLLQGGTCISTDEGGCSGAGYAVFPNGACLSKTPDKDGIRQPDPNYECCVKGVSTK